MSQQLKLPRFMKFWFTRRNDGLDQLNELSHRGLPYVFETIRKLGAKLERPITGILNHRDDSALTRTRLTKTNYP
jgi:hypothetical protein